MANILYRNTLFSRKNSLPLSSKIPLNSFNLRGTFGIVAVSMFFGVFQIASETLSLSNTQADIAAKAAARTTAPNHTTLLANLSNKISISGRLISPSNLIAQPLAKAYLLGKVNSPNKVTGDLKGKALFESKLGFYSYVVPNIGNRINLSSLFLSKSTAISKAEGRANVWAYPISYNSLQGIVYLKANLISNLLSLAQLKAIPNNPLIEFSCFMVSLSSLQSRIYRIDNIRPGISKINSSDKRYELSSKESKNGINSTLSKDNTLSKV